MSARLLLSKLLDYVMEQAKEIDPRGFNLSSHKGLKQNLTSKPCLVLTLTSKSKVIIRGCE
jgi:hypothetical protein